MTEEEERAALLASLGSMGSMGFDDICSSDDSEHGDDGAGTEELLQAVVRASFIGDIRCCAAALDDCAAHGVDASGLTCNGRSGLLAACHAGHAEVAALLLARGVRPRAAEGTAGRHDATALQLACGEGHSACTRLLLATEGHRVEAVDGSGASALLKACAAGHSECTLLVLVGGADPNTARPVALETALHAASAGGHLECVRALLHHGASVGLADQHGSTALHHASARGHTDIIHLLCAAGAGVSAVDERGRTPLHAAAGEGKSAACAALAGHGAPCEATCALGGTPLLAAIEQGHAECATALLAHGACADGLDAISLAELHTLVGPDGHTAVPEGRQPANDLQGGDLEGLPLEYAQQAARLAPVLRRLLVGNEPPSAASAGAVLRASANLPLSQQTAAWRDLARPAAAQLVRRPAALDAAACAALRAAIDTACEGDQASEDSVDGLREYQLRLSGAQLAAIIGDAASRELTVELPRAASMALAGANAKEADAPPPAALRPYQIFARRYSPLTRPWFTFHTDVAALTANVALCSSSAHQGGTLLALFEGAVHAIERDEGEATVHPSTLLHGVTRMQGGQRYSLLLFFSSTPPLPRAT